MLLQLPEISLSFTLNGIEYVPLTKAAAYIRRKGMTHNSITYVLIKSNTPPKDWPWTYKDMIYAGESTGVNYRLDPKRRFATEEETVLRSYLIWQPYKRILAHITEVNNALRRYDAGERFTIEDIDNTDLPTLKYTLLVLDGTIDNIWVGIMTHSHVSDEAKTNSARALEQMIIREYIKIWGHCPVGNVDEHNRDKENPDSFSAKNKAFLEAYALQHPIYEPTSLKGFFQ